MASTNGTSSPHAALAPCAERRARFLAQLGPRAAALLVAPPPATRNNDVEYKYRPPSDFVYLTGFVEPEAVCLLAPGREQRFVLFVRPRDKDQEVWIGKRAGVEGAKEIYGADAAYTIGEIDAKLPDLLADVDELHYAVGVNAAFDAKVCAAIERLRHSERRGRRPPRRIVDPRYSLHELRLRKSPDEIATLRRAVEVTREAHLAACRAARPGATEYEIEALLDYTFRRRGGVGPGYPSIVGTGANATVLHYTENAATLREGECLLVDAGAEVDYYTADVTRVYPVGGRFPAPARRIYEVVLRSIEEATARVRPGVTLADVHDRAVEVLVDGLLDLKLLTGPRDPIIKDKTYRKYYMHQTSHWLGLDVHDAGAYLADGQPRPLEPGMVLTVEPGLYIAPDSDAPAEYRGIGVRIEDDVLVTETGHDVLTAAIPKKVDDVEAAARG